LRRNLFGYDINKKGTPQGTVKVWVFFVGFVFFYWFYDLGLVLIGLDWLWVTLINSAPRGFDLWKSVIWSFW
jgi:hypothetical protein